MFDYSRVRNYYIACGYTDMRKQIDGLVALVELQYGKKADETSLFLFCGVRSDRIKALYWDGTGYVCKSQALFYTCFCTSVSVRNASNGRGASRS